MIGAMTYNLGLLMRTLFGIGTPKQAMAGGRGWPLGPMIGTYTNSLERVEKPASEQFGDSSTERTSSLADSPISNTKWCNTKPGLQDGFTIHRLL